MWKVGYSQDRGHWTDGRAEGALLSYKAFPRHPLGAPRAGHGILPQMGQWGQLAGRRSQRAGFSCF